MQRIMEFFKENFWAVLILLMLVLGVAGYQIASAMGKGAIEDMGTSVGQAAAMKFDQYDNSTVLGTEVLNTAQKFKQTVDFSVLVKTGLTPAGFYAQNTAVASPKYYAPGTGDLVAGAGTTSSALSVPEMSDESDQAHYVNKNARFGSKIYKDANGVVKLIVFTQK